MKTELPFDEICVSADEIVLRLNGSPMARWPLPPLSRGDVFSLAGVRGAIDVEMTNADREGQ